MFMTVHWNKWFDQRYWSLGYCEWCDRAEAIRIGHVINTTSVYFVIPVNRNVGSKVSCCDYCGLEAKRDPDAEVVDTADWNYRDGIEALFEMCAPQYDFGPLRFSTEDEVISLLQAPALATKYTKIDLNVQWLPPLIGGCVGAALAVVPAALSRAENMFGAVALAILGGGFVGGLLGILAGGFLTSEKIARTTIEYNALKYDIDGDLLTDVAANFPGRIRRAVKAAVR